LFWGQKVKGQGHESQRKSAGVGFGTLVSELLLLPMPRRFQNFYTIGESAVRRYDVVVGVKGSTTLNEI